MTRVNLLNLQITQTSDRTHIVADVTDHSYLGHSTSSKHCIPSEEESHSWLIEGHAARGVPRRMYYLKFIIIKINYRTDAAIDLPPKRIPLFKLELPEF